MENKINEEIVKSIITSKYVNANNLINQALTQKIANQINEHISLNTVNKTIQDIINIAKNEIV